MILQSLKEYYDRVLHSEDMVIAPEGWEAKEISFIVVLQSDGKFHHIEDTRESFSKKLIGKKYIVPNGVKRSSGVAANLLWDNPTYLFGVISNKTKLKAEKEGNEKIKKILERAEKSKEDFRNVLQSRLSTCKSVEPILIFLNNEKLEDICKDPLWEELKNSDAQVTFKILGDDKIICEKKEVKDCINNLKSNTDAVANSICCVTGERDEIERIHKSIKGVKDTQAVGGNIISFNFPASESYGKRKGQGLNSSVGKKAAFAYTTALNMLLDKNSKQRLLVGDATTVFWASKCCDLEDNFLSFFDEPKDENPNALCDAVKELYCSVKNGKYNNNDNDNVFHVLGLSPNIARISIRFWKTGKISDFANNIAKYFDDLSIVKPVKEPEHYSLWRLLVNVSAQGKSDNIPPKLAGELLRAIMDNTPFPVSLLQAALQRIRSEPERRVTPIRAAIIKAYINRYERVYCPNNKELFMSLDVNQSSIGYQLGRLFAVLAKIQSEAQPGINTTISDRFYASACSTPVTVFANLLRLKNHHLAKIEAKGRVVFFESLLGEIIGKLSFFPPHLDMNEQGKFAIGYYHQWQSFFVKKSEENKGVM